MTDKMLKFFRGDLSKVTSAPIGAIWFDTESNVIKVRIAEGTEADWEVYGTSPADIEALALRVTTLEGAVTTINTVTLPALKAELEKAIEDAVAAEAEIARAAEKALGERIDALAAKTVSINEKTTGHVTVSKTTDETTGAVVYTVAENDIASAEALAQEIIDARAAEGALAGRLDIIEGEATVEGSIKKAVADANAYTDAAKAELIGDAETLKTFGAVEDALAEVENAAKAAATTINEKSEGHVTVAGVQDETTGAWTYTISESDIASKAVVDTLVGDDANLSARDIVKDEVAKQLTSENISDSFDTLREMAEWLSSHPDDVQDMNDAISANTEAIEEEVERAKAAEAVLQAAIEGETAVREAEMADLKTAVNTYTDEAVAAEAAIARAAEQANADAIAAEVARATAAEEAIAADVAALTTEVSENALVTSEALNDLNARIEQVASDLADKNVTAEGDDYITVSAEGNHVTVAAQVEEGVVANSNKLVTSGDVYEALCWVEF